MIPIVIAEQGDSVATGVVSSLARPGGNITGLNVFSPQTSAKFIQLLKEVQPQIRRFGFLSNPDTTSMAREVFKSMRATAKSLKVELQSFEVRGPQEFESIFAEMAKRRVAAIGVQGDPMLTAHNALVASIAARHRIATIGTPEFAEAGALMGYGADRSVLFRRAATYVDKILKGAKTGGLPIELPTNSIWWST
ncbi:MAG: hypothetical protein EXR33_07920 [Betaproteobacteria bacterium]|nr:hypothetical protein [Betaproteobacteria bacterium]